MQKGRFEGDVAVKELRERMALAPDMAPEPPMHDDGKSSGMVRRLLIRVTIVAIAVYGCVWTSTLREQPVDGGFTLAGYGNPGAAFALNTAAIFSARRRSDSDCSGDVDVAGDQ